MAMGDAGLCQPLRMLVDDRGSSQQMLEEMEGTMLEEMEETMLEEMEGTWISSSRA